MVPGWPYSVVAAPETGRTSWTAVLDAVRLEPGADVAAVTTVQIREVVERLVSADQWRPGDPHVLVVLDAGYDAPRIAHPLAGLPVEILGRLRSDRVMRRPTPSRKEFSPAHPEGGRPPKRGGEFVLGDLTTWGTEQAVTTTDTRLCGKAAVQAWDRLHPRLTRRSAWLHHDGLLPPHGGHRHPPGRGETAVRWSQQTGWAVVSGTGATAADVDRCRQSLESSRPMDLAGDRRLRPTPPRPASDHRPPQPLGEAGRGEQTDSRPRSRRVQEPLHEDRLTGRCTETTPSRPRPATGADKPPSRHPSRRGQSPRHRRGIQPPRPPQGRHNTAPNWL
ncbi:transposase [Streptomyces sp. NPDC094143]|uniref:transposase n=1 Tax=Streptomyces sp. NPDC094143 TaxID=3155310 RepID=UPI00332F99A2